MRFKPEPILHQDFVEGLLAVLSPIDNPEESSCPICTRTYGRLGPGIQTHLDWLSQLPGAFHKTYNEHRTDAVKTPCNHIFCTFCIGVWLSNTDQPNCPLCRTAINIVPLDTYGNTDDGAPIAAIEGLSIGLHVSSRIAEEIHNILDLSTRKILLTEASMSFTWNTDDMLYDLPMIMVTVARRFYYQEQNNCKVPRPVELSYMKLHNPMDNNVGQRQKNLDFFLRHDAPLVQHQDVRSLYALLCHRIKDLEDVVGDRRGRCATWEGSARMLLYKIVHEEMPDADGGVGKRRWWAYVWCVVKGLLVWQAYCERVRKLVVRQTRQASVDVDGTEEGVWTYSIA
jgi:hypothetical protein